MKEIMDPEKGYHNSQNVSVTLEVRLNADARVRVRVLVEEFIDD